MLSIIRRKTRIVDITKQGNGNVPPACHLCSRRLTKEWSFGEGTICSFHRIRCRVQCGRSFWHQPETPIDGLSWDSTTWELTRISSSKDPDISGQKDKRYGRRKEKNPKTDPPALDSRVREHEPIHEHEPIPGRVGPADTKQRCKANLRGDSGFVSIGRSNHPKLSREDCHNTRVPPGTQGVRGGNVQLDKPRERPVSYQHGSKKRSEHRNPVSRSHRRKKAKTRTKTSKLGKSRDIC
uniref:Protein VP5 n=1 Tax=Drosophila x virus (isolate Chung/1996) TaxID=654931 RepID=VP5_DXV96|nr:RecName: Full=Protein VP5 [Drosophila x virus (isolate Chung)]